MRHWLLIVWVLLFPTLSRGAAPVRQSRATFELPAARAPHLSLVTHGWNTDFVWPPRFRDAIRNQVDPMQWDVLAFDWRASAGAIFSTEPHEAVQRAAYLGERLGQQIVAREYERVHLYGHSAGGELVAAAANYVKRVAPDTVVQLTLLDPYAPGRHGGDDGRLADWSDHYFMEDSGSGLFPYLAWTDDPLPQAFNVDISDFDPVFSFNPDTGFGIGHLEVRYQYEQTINGDNPWGNVDFGFPISLEAQGDDWGPAAEFAKGDTASLGGAGNAPYRQRVVTYQQRIDDFTALQIAEQSERGVAVTADSFGVAADQQAAWVRFFVDADQTINSLRFTADFLSSASGVAAVYWDNEPVRILEKDLLPEAAEVFSVYLADQSAGRHELAVRVDEVGSMFVISDVVLEYIDLTLTPPVLTGDYNGNGQVEQADLDLVLLHWGQSVSMVPARGERVWLTSRSWTACCSIGAALPWRAPVFRSRQLFCWPCSEPQHLARCGAVPINHCSHVPLLYKGAAFSWQQNGAEMAPCNKVHDFLGLCVTPTRCSALFRTL